MVYISFDSTNRGRTGNQIFQYLICKVIEIKIGHKYINYNELCIQNVKKEDLFIFNDENIDDLLMNKNNIWYTIKDKYLIGEGFFQKSEYFINLREQLLEILYSKNNNDYWIYDNKKMFIKDFLFYENNFFFNNDDVVLSLRLDDFIQLPCKTSDIIPPSFYINILNDLTFKKLYIVCDKLRWNWEYNYLDFFKKWNPILIQGNVIHDASIMRDSKILFHSNSTLCWIMSFFSKTKIKRYIPITHFYKGQSLQKICETDTIIEINPLTHNEVFDIHS